MNLIAHKKYSTKNNVFSLTRLCVLLLLSLPLLSALAAQPKIFAPDGYSIETVTTPKDIRFHVTGLDSQANGDVYVATRYGDVWKYSAGKWSLFANGLHEATGLLCDDDGSILVAHKPELTRLIDVNKDGVADQYIKVADNWDFHDNYHEYSFGPVKDNKGNLFGTLNLSHGDPQAHTLGIMGSGGGYRGFAYKVNTAGEFIPYAWGLRSPAGIGASPKGEVFITDNQGDWVATSKLHLLEEGKFYGHPISFIDVEGYTLDKIKGMTPEQFNEMREKPVVWFPHREIAKSPGNPAWNVSKGKFGPFEDQIFIGDQRESNVFRVLLDKVNGKYQGAVINFMNGFQSGNIRLDFDKNGELWIGQTARGWGAVGPKDFGLQKVVWDGTLPFELLSMKITTTGFKLTFTEPLNNNAVALENFKAEQWHYLYHGEYGSPKQNLEAVKIKDVRISKDRKEVDIILPVKADKVMALDFSGVTSETGRSTSVGIVYYTVNQLPKS